MRLNKRFFISIVYASEKFGKWLFYHVHYAIPKLAPLAGEIRNARRTMNSSAKVLSELFSDSRISFQWPKRFFAKLIGFQKSTASIATVINMPVYGCGQYRFAALLPSCSALLFIFSFFFLDEKEPKNQDKTKLLPANPAHPRRFVKPARFGSFGLDFGPFKQKIRLIFIIFLQPIFQFWTELFDFQFFRFSLVEATEEASIKRKSKSSRAVFLKQLPGLYFQGGCFFFDLKIVLLHSLKLIPNPTCIPCK